MTRIFKPTEKQVKEIKEGHRRIDEGLYHAQITDGTQSESGDDVFDAEILEGTEKGCIGMVQKFFFKDNDAGKVRLSRFCVVAGVLSPETLDKAVNGEATIDFDEILPKLIGAQIVFKIRHGKYKDKDTGETKDTSYTDIFNVNSPEVADIPKDANALKSLASGQPAKQAVNF
jgi:hypothetical protein